MFLPGIDNEQSAGQLLHVFDTAQVFFQFGHFMAQDDDFFLGQQIEGAFFFHFFQVMESLDPGLDGLEVGQHTAQPSFVHIEHAAAFSFFFDGSLSLLFGAYEQHGAALGSQFTQEAVAFFHLFHGLLQIDDVDPVPFGEDVGSHLGVPAAGLMTEVYACFQKLFHGYNCHFCFLLFFPPQIIFRLTLPAASKDSRVLTLRVWYSGLCNHSR